MFLICWVDFQGSKPWRYTGEEVNMDREDIKMLVKKWWEIYDDETLDYENTVNVDRIKGALTNAGGLHYVPAPSAA